MEDNLKGRVMLVLGILNVIFLLLWVSSCNDVRKHRDARYKEMDIRLESEQKLDGSLKQKLMLEDKINKIQQELSEEKAAMEVTRKSLIQEQLISSSLKTELEKISRLKVVLEENLKAALLKGKSTAFEKPKR